MKRWPTNVAVILPVMASAEPVAATTCLIAPNTQTPRSADAAIYRSIASAMDALACRSDDGVTL